MAAPTITIDRKTWGGTLNADGKREYTVDYLVQFASPGYGPHAAAAALRLRVGQPYRVENDQDNSAVLKTLAPRCEGQSNLFRVTANWGPRDPQQETANPLARPTKYRYSSQAFQTIAEKDAFGAAILNSSGEQFDPPLQIDDSRAVVTVTRNVAYFDAGMVREWTNAVNRDTFGPFKRRTVKIAGINADGPNFENEIQFWEQSIEFHIRFDGWRASVLDCGRNILVNGKLVPLNMFDDLGNETAERVADPVPIRYVDKNNSIRIDSPTPDTVDFLEFVVYREKSFAQLGL